MLYLETRHPLDFEILLKIDLQQDKDSILDFVVSSNRSRT